MNLTELAWFVLRDLRGPNAKTPAYIDLGKAVEVFTPMRWKLVTVRGRRKKVKVPFLPDLLFAHSTRHQLDRLLPRIHKLQYRYYKGGKYMDPMIVPEEDMNRFIRAVDASVQPTYYAPGEIDPGMIGHRIRIVGGPLDGCIGHLLKIRGTRTKRILIELQALLAVIVEVQPEFIQVLD